MKARAGRPAPRCWRRRGSARVVIGVRDPDPRTNGRASRCCAAGIAVVEDAAPEAARAAMAGFFARGAVGAAACNAEARDLARREDRAALRREPLDHRTRGARPCPSGAGSGRCDPGRAGNLGGGRAPARRAAGGAGGAEPAPGDAVARTPAPEGWSGSDWLKTSAIGRGGSSARRGGSRDGRRFPTARDLVDRLLLYRAPILIGAGKSGAGSDAGADRSRRGAWPVAARRLRGCLAATGWRSTRPTDMFTGLHHRYRHHRAASSSAGTCRVTIVLPPMTWPMIELGASIACSGVLPDRSGQVRAPARRAGSPSTSRARRSRAPADGMWSRRTPPQSRARAAKLGDELGGHIVTGHVDGVGERHRLAARGRPRIVVGFAAGRRAARPTSRPRARSRSTASRSTVNEVDDRSDGVPVFDRQHHPPHRCRSPPVRHVARPATRVNIEIDVLARYLGRMVELRALSASRLTSDRSATASFPRPRR